MSIKVIIVGVGGIAIHHMRIMLDLDTEITALVEPSDNSRIKVKEFFKNRGISTPPFFNTLTEALASGISADVVFVCTPHKYHFENCVEALRAGIDVLVEKPMVLNVEEAKELIKVRDETSRLLVIAFQGGLSPAVWKARELINNGYIGEISGVSAAIYQGWKQGTKGTWRQDPEISGGGFLFDTGSHMINTVLDLIDDDVYELYAKFDNRGTPVEIRAVLLGRFKSGAMFSMLGVGDSIGCSSCILVFGNKRILETGAWGGYLREFTADRKEFKDIPVRESRGVWDEFLRIRRGEEPNRAPAEKGLRFAYVMDMIRRSVMNNTPVINNRLRF